MSNSCDPMDCNLPGSSVHGILQARTLKWVAISFSKQFSWPRDWTRVSCTAGRFFTNWARREAHIINTIINSMAWVNKFNQLKCSFEIDILLPQSFKMKSFLLKEVNQLDQHGCKYYREMFSWYSMQLKESESVSHSVVSNSLQPHWLYSPWNSPGQNTGMSSLSLLQGSSQPRDPTQGYNPGLSHCRQILHQLSHKGSPRILEWVACPFSSRSSQHRNKSRVSCVAGGFFTNWAIREALEQVQFSSVQSLSRVRLFATPWIAALQASLSITNSWSSPRLKSIESSPDTG